MLARMSVFSQLTLCNSARRRFLWWNRTPSMWNACGGTSRNRPSGRVVLIPEGAWSKKSSIDLNLGVANSGTGSMMYKEAGSKVVSVPVRPIDDMVAEYKASRIDFIKMDIEGAEREALKGAEVTLKRWQPRLALDSYHLPDDAMVLPKVILAANPKYRTVHAVHAS